MRDALKPLDDFKMPDLWERARSQTPEPGEPHGPRRSRVPTFAAAVALLAVISLIALTLQPLRGDHPGPSETASSSTTPLALGHETMQLSAPAAQVAVAGGWVWAAEQRRDIIEKIDPSTGEVVDAIPVFADPDWLSGGDGVLWVGLRGDEIAAVVGIDTATNDIVFTQHGVYGPVIQTDEGLWAFEYRMPNPNWMALFDPRTGDVISHIDVDSQPFDIAASGDAVWLLDGNDLAVLLVEPGADGAKQVTDHSSGIWLAADASGAYFGAWRGGSADAPGGDATSAFAGLDGSVTPFGDIYNFRPTVVADGDVWFVAGPRDGDLTGLCGMRTTDGVVDRCADIPVGVEGLRDPVAFEPSTGTLWAADQDRPVLYEVPLG